MGMPSQLMLLRSFKPLESLENLFSQKFFPTTQAHLSPSLNVICLTVVHAPPSPTYSNQFLS